MSPLVFLQTNKVLAFAALAPAAGAVTYGAFVSVTAPPPHPSRQQQTYVSKTYKLSYADGQKAMFKTDYGASLVFVGSLLGETGRVTEIARHANGWAVSTSKGYTFTVTR